MANSSRVTRGYGMTVWLSVALVAVGCGAQPTPEPAPRVLASLIDPRWMDLAVGEQGRWHEIERRITPDFQVFGLRPVGETEGPRLCQGCGENAPTAEVKVYEEGRFDAADVRTGEPVDVAGAAGFYFPFGDNDVGTDRDGYRDAIVAWPYAEGAWATVRGMSTMTAELNRLLELARAVRPNERTPVRTPLSALDVPAAMPLASVYRSGQPIGEGANSGSTLSFGPCFASTKSGPCQDQMSKTGTLSVTISRRDDQPDRVSPDHRPYQIGERQGRYDASTRSAEVLIDDEIHVRFGLKPARDAQPADQFEDILASVVWVPDAGDETTWSPLTDWVRYVG